MRPDVCMKQRLYDEFLEELQEECLALLTNTSDIVLTSDSVPEWWKAQRYCQPIYVAVPQFTVSVIIEL